MKTNQNINTTNNINKFNANNNIYQEKLAKKITILDNVKEYLPEDISMEEIREIVFNAIGNYIVDKSEYKKGVNLTEEQAEVICDILFNHIIGNNEIYLFIKLKLIYILFIEKYYIQFGWKIK